MPADTPARRARLLAAALGTEVLAIPNTETDDTWFYQSDTGGWVRLNKAGVNVRWTPVPTSDGDYLLALLEALVAKKWSIEIEPLINPPAIEVTVYHGAGYAEEGPDTLAALVAAAERALGVTT